MRELLRRSPRNSRATWSGLVSAVSTSLNPATFRPAATHYDSEGNTAIVDDTQRVEIHNAG